MVEEVIGHRSVPQLNPHAKSINDHIDDRLMIFLKVRPKTRNQVNQNGELNSGTVLRCNIFFEGIIKILGVGENIHKLPKNQILLLLVSQKEQSNPFFDRAHSDSLQAYFRLNNFINKHQLVQQSSHFELKQRWLFKTMMLLHDCQELMNFRLFIFLLGSHNQTL